MERHGGGGRQCLRMTIESRWTKMRARIPGLLCLLVLSGILVAGLWPFRGPRNGVTWLGDEHGLRLSGHSTLWSTRLFQKTGQPGEEVCSLELWLQPGPARDSNTILSFSVPENPLQFTLHQYRSLLILDREIQDGRRRKATIGTEGIFHQSRPVFVTVTSGPQQSAMYLDGALKRTFPGSRFAEDCAGQLIIGTSPVVDESWAGKLRGLAVYGQELTAAQVLQHFESWTAQGRPELSDDERVVALYLFDERAGSVVHNAVPAGPDLYIPKRYALVHQIFLQPFWDEFVPRRSYVKDLLINIVGLMPLGFVFVAYWSSVRPIKHAVLITTLLGFAVSLTIEVLQSYIPSRDSGTTDLITNTLGTFLGAKLYDLKFARVLLARIYPA
jgi:VanZ family protein